MVAVHSRSMVNAFLAMQRKVIILVKDNNGNTVLIIR